MGQEDVVYGNPIIGDWICDCGHHEFPRTAKEKKLPYYLSHVKMSWWERGLVCPECGNMMQYDEYE